MDWERLGRAVVSRRVALGYERRDDFAAARGLGSRTLGEIERGDKTGYRKSLLARVEAALAWTPGSIDAVLAGGEPTPLEYAPVVVAPEGMDPLAAEVVYLLGPDSPLGEEDKDDMRDLFGHLIKRYRTIARIEQREAGGG